MFNDLRETINAYKARDPAARSSFEILTLYPGLKATRAHRRAQRSAGASSSTTAWA